MSTADTHHDRGAYSRYDDTDPLAHATRAKLYECVEAEPGLYLSQLGRRLDVPLSTVRHHVRVLREEGHVESRTDDGRRRFYPRGTEHPELIACLRGDGPAGIVAALSREGALTVSALARELDRDPSTVSHHLDRLVAVDAVTRTKRGRTVENRLSPDVPSWLVAEVADA
jgi:predicted transcriptional regulator